MNAINWDAVSALAEIIGVITVVGSLIFVGFQMRQNTKALNMNSNHGIQEAFRDAVCRLAENDTLSSIFHSAISDPESITGIEKYRFALYLQSALQVYADAFYQNRIGTLDAFAWESIDAQMGNFLKVPAVRNYWESSGSNYPKPFVTYINSEVLVTDQEDGYRVHGT